MPLSRADLQSSLPSAGLLRYLAQLAPDLALGGALAVEVVVPPVDATDGAPAIAERGFTLLGATAGAQCEQLRDAVDAIVIDGSPATLVYAFDAVWALGEAIRVAVSQYFGCAYDVAGDAWAWSIAPGGGRGWTAHRGISHLVLDRARPEVLNAWVALSDVSVDRACMHAVPLDVDAGYPGALERTDSVRAAVALPVSAGSVLAWNANVLHWGGECLPTARGRRTSCSFTLVRADSKSRIGLPIVRVGDLDLTSRIELIARQLMVYGEGQPDVSPQFLEWARATCALGAMVRSPHA